VIPLKIKWLGHASFLIEVSDKRIYIDPYALSEGPEPADLILITHDHYDHCDVNAINEIKKLRTHILGSESVAKKISDTGILRPGDVTDFNGIKIKAVPSYNIGKHFHPRGSGIGFVIEAEGKRVYHAGDTDLIPEMKELEGITVALLPVGGTYTMNADEAVEAVKVIKPEIAVPMHYGSIVGSRADANRFKVRAERETETRIEILENRSLEI